MKPSFLALSVSGILIGLFLIVLLNNLYKKNELDSSIYQTYMLLLMASIAFGVHGLGHAYAEIHYDYDPLKGGALTY